MLSVTLTLIYFSFFFTHSHRHKNSHTLTHKYPRAHWMLLFLLCVEGNIFVLLLRFQNFLKVSSLVKVSDCKKANPWTSLSRKMGQQREKEKNFLTKCHRHKKSSAENERILQSPGSVDEMFAVSFNVYWWMSLGALMTYPTTEVIMFSFHAVQQSIKHNHKAYLPTLSWCFVSPRYLVSAGRNMGVMGIVKPPSPKLLQD